MLWELKILIGYDGRFYLDVLFSGIFVNRVFFEIIKVFFDICFENVY